MNKKFRVCGVAQKLFFTAHTVETQLRMPRLHHEPAPPAQAASCSYQNRKRKLLMSTNSNAIAEKAGRVAENASSEFQNFIADVEDAVGRAGAGRIALHRGVAGLGRGRAVHHPDR